MLGERFRWLRERSLAYARPRWLLAALAVLAALAGAVGRPSPPARSVEAVAVMLGAAAGGEVRPDDFVWEERGGWLSDTFLGRSVLFLAARSRVPGGPRGPADLVRARVRLTRDGRPIDVRWLRELTATSLADERDLVARGSYVAFATVAAGVVQGVTVLDLAGDASSREARTRSERLGSDLAAWLETGSARGAGRTEIVFDAPPAVVRLDLADGALVLALGPEGLPAALDLRTGALNTGPSNPTGARAQRVARPAPRAGDLAPEIVHALFGDLAARSTRALVAGGHSLSSRFRRGGRKPALPRPREWAVAAPLPPGSQLDGWPPAPVRGPLDGAGEGVWTAALPPFAPRPIGIGEAAPPAVVEAFVRPDASVPEAVVRLVAFDLRQLELGLEAGTSRPRPVASLHGTGAVPDLVRRRAVAVFSGGRPIDADARGTIARGRLLAPPVAGAGSVLIGRDTVSMGPWSFGADVPVSVRSLWQTAAAPLVAPGVSRLASVGGDPGDRAAIGRARAGHLVYAYGHDVSPAVLARAIELADCDLAYELGAMGGRPAFAFVGFPSDQPDPFGVLLDPAMPVAPARLALASPDELFYAAFRDPRPNVPLPDALAWVPDAGRQPPPGWLPAVHTVTLTNGGAQVHLHSFAAGRYRWRIRGGSRELTARVGPPFAAALADEEQARVGVAFGLGIGKTTKRRPARGLATSGAVGLAIRPEGGLLVADAGGLAILRSEDAKALAPDADASELPLTAEDGRLRPEARELGGMRTRVAVCVLSDGTVLTATTTFDSDEATTSALLDRGCVRVVALDRGAHQASFVHRADTATPPSQRYEVTALYGVDQPATGRVVALP